MTKVVSMSIERHSQQQLSTGHDECNLQSALKQQRRGRSRKTADDSASRPVNTKNKRPRGRPKKAIEVTKELGQKDF